MSDKWTVRIGTQAASARRKWGASTLGLAGFCLFLGAWALFGHILVGGPEKVVAAVLVVVLFILIISTLFYSQIHFAHEVVRLASQSAEVRAIVGEKQLPPSAWRTIDQFDTWRDQNRLLNQPD